jgi:imidazolonepropionase-like amidohydrolase
MGNPGERRPVRRGMRATRNRRAAPALLLGLLALLAAPLAFSRGPEPALALVGARIYPAPAAAPILDGTVVLSGGKIAAVGPRAGVAIPAGAQELDCKGLVLTAGFQNSHVHFTEDKWAGAGSQPASVLAGHLQAMLTRYGFTTVVDTASSLENTAALRRRVGSGEVPGPRIFTAGEGLYPPEGIPYYLKTTLPAVVLSQLPQPRSPQQAVDVVENHVRGGSDIIKLFTGSWVKRGTVLPMPEEIATAAAAAAHRHGKLVFSHPSNLAGLEVAIRAHVDVLAHVLDDARGLTPRHLERMKEQNMAVIPTLKLFDHPPYLFELLDEVRDYSRLGGQILFGTDVGYLTDYDPTTEYELMESAGLGWRDILATLTTNPAQRFGEAARRGRIEPGLDADLVVLAADPAAYPRNFVDVRYTIRGGRVIFSAPGRPAARLSMH